MILPPYRDLYNLYGPVGLKMGAATCNKGGRVGIYGCFPVYQVDDRRGYGHGLVLAFPCPLAGRRSPVHRHRLPPLCQRRRGIQAHDPHPGGAARPGGRGAQVPRDDPHRAVGVVVPASASVFDLGVRHRAARLPSGRQGGGVPVCGQPADGPDGPGLPQLDDAALLELGRP